MAERRTNIDVWDSISLDLICIQVEDKIEYINTAGAKMLGAITSGQLVGKPILEFVHPEYHEIAVERVRQLTTGGLVVCPSEEKWLRLDGKVIDVEVAAMPICYQGKLAVQLIARKDVAHSWRCTARSRRKRR